ncbi:MAG: DUF1269 domain-containing protein [Chloroflexia bacterium]|nr:DUF1269 domain-containing protein [Chloroflexia bacterium]
MPTMNLETWGARKVLTATFDSLGGANVAVKKLQEMEKKDLLDLDNSITVSRNAWDKIDVHQTTGDSGKKGAGVGALVGAVAGLIFPPSLLASTALGGAVGAMVGKMRGEYFDDSYVKAMADALQPGQSMLIAIVDPDWETEIQAALDGLAQEVRWTPLTAAAAKALAQQAEGGAAAS